MDGSAPSERRLVLIRHGRSSHVHSGWIVVSPLLRELDLEPPALAGVRLPLAAWAIAVGARVLGSTLRGDYPPRAEAARVERALEWLDGLAAEHALIIAVTHASFRRQLSQRPIRAGWRAEPGSRSVQHWSAWAFRRRL